jgi:solute carrier family 1 (neuronal/epithelial high affinity glutamate transporter), member 1
MTDKPEGRSGRRGSQLLLPLLLLVGAVAGFTVGGIWGEYWVSGTRPIMTGIFKLFGDVFMNLLKMVVVPLVVCSMIVGMATLGEQKKVGRTFGMILLFYLTTTILAVVLGVILVSLIEPGVGAGVAGLKEPVSSKVVMWYDALFDMIRGLFPSNLVKSAAEGQILGLIVFSLIFGGLLTSFGERGKRLLEIIDTVNEVMMRFVRYVVWLAPLGVMGLVADRVGAAGGGSAVWQEISLVGKYFLTVLAGLLIHATIFLPLLLFLVARRSPIRQAGHFSEALLTAFSTGSSAATLPITIRNAELRAGFSPVAARSVLPLGATINMDGTALYEAVAVVFIAQVYGMDLSGMQLIVVVLTATLAAVGAAAIPEAGLVTMVMVLMAVNVPVEGIGLLLSVDWLLDRCRTTINVWGDTIGAAIISRRLKLTGSP